jgi:GDP-L-fucose synthase
MLRQSEYDEFRGKKVLVIGGTGLIGRPVVDILVNAGAIVTVVSLDDLQPNRLAEYVYLDLRYFNAAEFITKGMDYVFHLAGIKGSIEVTKTKPASFFVPLLQFNTNILEACRINNVKKVAFTSSIGAYESAEIFHEDGITQGLPMDMYPGWAKRMAELQIQAYKEQYGIKNFVVLRPCNVYGPGDNFDPNNAMVVPSLMYRIASGENPVKIWGDGSAIRDFAYNVDVAEGIIQAMHYMPDVNYINLGSGKDYTIKNLVDTLHEFIDFNHEWDTTKSNGFPKRVMDITKARMLINFEPITTLRDGLEHTWKWFLANKEEYLKRKNYFNEDNRH